MSTSLDPVFSLLVFPKRGCHLSRGRRAVVREIGRHQDILVMSLLEKKREERTLHILSIGQLFPFLTGLALA